MSKGRGEQGSRGAEEQMVTDVAAVWGAPLIPVHCSHCGRAHLVPEPALSGVLSLPKGLLSKGEAEGEAIPSRCPFCLQGPVTRQPAYLRDEPPEQAVPYQVSRHQLAGILDRWTRGIWFRPAELKDSLLAKRVRNYIFPLWLVDGRVEGTWRADAGFDYQVVSHRDRYSEGAGWSSQETKETRVRWEPRAGRLSRVYENLDVPALDDHHRLVARLGAFDLRQRVAYTPEMVSDAAVRIPPLEPEAAWAGAETAFVRAAEEECRQAAGADHIRAFALESEYDDLNWTLLLLPAYVTWYREGERVWPVLVNGQTGRVSGVRRASTRKANVTSLILGAVGLGLFLVGVLLALLGVAFPPVAVLGGVVLVIGLLLAVAAPLPAIGAWVHNRRSAPGPGH